MANGFKAYPKSKKHPRTTNLTKQYNKPPKPNLKNSPQKTNPPNLKDENGEWIQSISLE